MKDAFERRQARRHCLKCVSEMFAQDVINTASVSEKNASIQSAESPRAFPYQAYQHLPDYAYYLQCLHYPRDYSTELDVLVVSS